MAEQLPARKGERRESMTRRRDNPFQQWRDALFDRFFGGWPLMPFEESGETSWPMRTWDLDLDETDDKVRVRAEMPGFEPQDLDVQLNDNLLTIRAEKKKESDEEREYRSFRRVVTLPRGIDANNVQARYRNGVLELDIPKTPESRGRRIEIQADKGQPSKQLEGQGSGTQPA